MKQFPVKSYFTITSSGEWDPDLAVPLYWVEGDLWLGEADIRSDTMEFKVVIHRKDEHVDWESGPNRIVDLSDVDPEIVMKIECDYGDVTNTIIEPVTMTNLQNLKKAFLGAEMYNPTNRARTKSLASDTHD